MIINQPNGTRPRNATTRIARGENQKLKNLRLQRPLAQIHLICSLHFNLATARPHHSSNYKTAIALINPKLLIWRQKFWLLFLSSSKQQPKKEKPKHENRFF